MTLGQKIRKLRNEKRITQDVLCNGKITRNMLSEIECDKASPSLGTLNYIAQRLDIPISYLLSEDDSTFAFEKQKIIDEVKTQFGLKNYKRCVEILNRLQETDDELAYILSYCHFEIGRASVLRGSLTSGLDSLKIANKYAEKTIYDTSRIKNLGLLYSALAENIQSPLLEFDAESFAKNVDSDSDYEFYKYLIQDHSYNFNNPIFSKHIEAKELIKARKYREAIALLSEVENLSKSNYNAHIVFSVYSDLESCYKQLIDFESAYRYASKRLSLIEGFKA